MAWERRIKYETEDDLANEKLLADKVCFAWNCRLKKLPTWDGLDFIALQGKVVMGYAELRRRHRTFDQYPDVWFPVSKLVRAHGYYSATRRPTQFAVQFDDCFAAANVIHSKGEIVWDGHAETDDPADDREALLLIPMNEFVILGE